MFKNDFIARRMTRDRFLYINSALHPNIDQLMAEFRKTSQMYWTPHQELSIDETLFLFKGRVKFRQRMPMKPQSTGLKYFIMADNSGYIVDAFLYKGSGTKEVKIKGKEEKKNRDESQTALIVDYFIKQLKEKHIFYMDMYYGGMYVMENVINTGHAAVLTCQGNRPKELFNNYLALSKLSTFLIL
jgi:hypothetical protein